MSDVLSTSKRSEIMSRVRSRGNVATEIRLIEILRQHHLVGWRRNQKIFGSPDFVFRTERLAVFVDGCFWHGCKTHRSLPKTNSEFWVRKIGRNVRRDAVVRRTLNSRGWTVLRVWQHDLKHPDRVGSRIHRTLEKLRRRSNRGRQKAS